MLAILVILALTAHADPSVVDVIASWEAGCEAIPSYDLSIELTSYSYLKSGPSGEYQVLTDHGTIQPMIVTRSHILRSGRKRRGDFHLQSPPTLPLTMCYDGDRALILNIGPKGSTASLSGGILAMGSYEEEDYESRYRTILGSFDRVEVTRRREAKLQPREGRLFVLDVPVARDFREGFYNMRWRLWLDPEKNFLPVRMKTWMDISGVTQLNEEVENTLKEVSPGVWAVVVSETKLYAKGESNDPLLGKCMGLHVLKVVEPSRFGVEIDPKVFEPEIPFGCRVSDRVRNINYVKGTSDPDHYLAQLARQSTAALGTLAPAERRPPEMLFVPESWWLRNRSSLAWAAAVILAIAAVAVVIRRRDRREGA